MPNYSLSVYLNIVKRAMRERGLDPSTFDWFKLMEAANALKASDTDQSIARNYVFGKEFAS